MYIYYVTMPENKDRDIDAGKFSASLIGVLKGVAREHNKTQKENKVTFSELKQVYVNAASSNQIYTGYSKCEWALARVNMFLRVKSGENPYVLKANQEEVIGGIVFAAKVIEPKEEIDVSVNWIPSQEDFTKAKVYIKENELYFNFENTDELYLEDYKQIQLKNY